MIRHPVPTRSNNINGLHLRKLNRQHNQPPRKQNMTQTLQNQVEQVSKNILALHHQDNIIFHSPSLGISQSKLKPLQQ
jgi:predicted secreted Zn-dependent protease